MSQQDQEKWDRKYQDAGDSAPVPSEVIQSLADLLPSNGQALDVAGGSGRHAIWLAQRGLDVTLVDISPVGLARASQYAEQVGVTIQAIPRDVERDSLPPGRWDLILSVCFLYRPLFEAFQGALAPGGMLVVLQPTESNLQRHEKPPRRFLLKDGELPELVTGMEILRYEEGWLADGRHDALLVARRVRASE